MSPGISHSTCEIRACLYARNWSHPEPHWLSLCSQAGSLNLRLKMHFPQCFVLFQHLWESSGGSFGIYVGPFLEHPVSVRKKRQTLPCGNLSIWPFLQHSHKAVEGQEEKREGEISQQTQCQPQPHMRSKGSFSQPCSSGAASVQAWLPRQVASQAGRINKRWSVRLCFPSTGLEGRLLTLCWRQQWLQHLVSKKWNVSVKTGAKEGNRKEKANESEKWLWGRINIYSKNPQAPTDSI